MSLEAGRVLSTRYRLVRPLGQGSQGAVWIADHLALNTEVAVKLIDPELAKREDAVERFKREATAAAQLRSAHVVQILDHGIDEGQPFIVMELLDGEDLFERLNKRGRLSLRETSKVITQVCRALARAHAAGIVHRDLKPENVFLCNNEDDEVVKVLDFGVAKVTDPAKATMQRTNVGTLIGTPHYMSPEQVKGISEIDSRTDLWAIGVIAYQCVVGELPFDSEGVGDLLIKISVAEPPVPSKVWKGVPPQFDAWFAKACDKDPGKRFQSARELAEALARVVASVPEAMRGELPPRPASIRPPPVAPTSSPGTPAPTTAKPKSSKAPALPPRATASPAKPPPRAERAKTELLDPSDVEVLADTTTRGPVSEDIDDFEFDFDDEPPVIVSTAPPAVVAPAPAPAPKHASGVRAPMPSPAATPLPAAAPAQRVSATPPLSANPFLSDLGAPVLPAGLLDAPPPRPSAPAPEPVQAVIPRHPAPITAPGVDSGDRISAPPEIDGSRRKRVLAFVGVAFVLAAGGIAYVVVQSNMLPPGPVPAASVPPPPEPIEPPAVVAVPSPTASFGSPIPTTKKPTGRPGTTTKKTTSPSNTSKTTATAKQPDPPPDDGTIVIPDPPSEVPPAD
ncbi:serine/threonine-protein kinase [Polyangium jinanense]|uniref:Protein kinase n=1 Tax=Polyangium jinanense TaxID=2829994 RepID=A0A9X4APV9_9BACT|nr:serine/threonine-protein kinase [Polyangium jinanense]MDC3952830.1 protein kinase [Polyangium jinanense]MDC3980449.1 protein kinase [Polyangium jinanense]